jgi:hypothetical protein
MPTGLPGHLQPIFDCLHHDIVGLQIRWQMYRQLFCANDQRVALLNSVAPSFFGTVQEVLVDDVLSGIARITDKVKTCGRENLVLRQLVGGLDHTAHATLVKQLETKLGVVETSCGPITEVRHKRLAHRDRATATSPHTSPLPAISREIIEKSLAAIADFMNSFQFHFTDTTIAYAETITPLGDGIALVKSLRRAVEHRKLERQGEVPAIGELSSEFEDA